jgi:hemerythrin
VDNDTEANTMSMGWSDKLATGDARFDGAHKKLVGIVSRLAQGMETNASKELCSNLLNEFIEEAKLHFAMEEQFMTTLHYPKAEEHKAAHRTLIKDVLSFKTSYDAGLDAQSATLLVILDTWLTRDIMVADKELVDFIAAR